ncbi:hypothetical protein ADUPG1_003212, partial [Aduncisulcus paluster]
VLISDLEKELHDSALGYDDLLAQYDALNALKSDYDSLMEEWLELQQ